MSPTAPEPLSLAGKLDLIPGVLSLLAAGLVAAITGLWRTHRDAPTYHLHVAYAILRKSAERYSLAQLQWALPSTEQVYEQYARAAGFKPQTVSLGHGAKGHWVGDKHAKNVLIWYHGGGFGMAANTAFFEFWEKLVVSARTRDKDLAVFALSYTLSPHARYPTQLTQAVEALRYIVSQGRRPGSILLGGDSAGASLGMGVLSHLAHPHPAIQELKLREPLAGTVLMAPPASMDEKVAEGRDVYCGGDVLVPDVAIRWLHLYLGGAKRDYYTDPYDAPASWFESLPVKKILVLGGGNEVLRPIIEAFVEKVKPAFPAIELFIGRREAHVAPVYNIFVGDRKETEQGRRLKDWLTDVL
ncbi:putative carboxylesterase 6 [Metarhizium anisopliae]